MALPLLLCLSAALVLSGCGDPVWLPRAHKITVQQGNLVTQEQIEQIQVGMSREEVAGLIGVPIVTSPFHTNRWDYAFTRGPAGNRIKARRFSVLFADNQVASTEENYQTESGEIELPRYWFQRPGSRPPTAAN